MAAALAHFILKKDAITALAVPCFHKEVGGINSCPETLMRAANGYERIDDRRGAVVFTAVFEAFDSRNKNLF